MKIIYLVLAAVTLGFAFGNAAPQGSSGAATGNREPLVPKQGALLGLYYGAGSIEETNARIGRRPQVHLVFYSWRTDWSVGAKSDLATGRIPLVNWEPARIDFNKIA